MTKEKGGPDGVFSPTEIGLLDSSGEKAGKDFLAQLILDHKIRRSDLFSDDLAPKTPLEVERGSI